MRVATYTNFVAEQIYHKRGRYTYDEKSYKSGGKIRITCPKHGDFWQRASEHNNRKGCPRCGCLLNKLARLRKTYRTSKEFIQGLKDKGITPIDLTLYKAIVYKCYCGEIHTQNLSVMLKFDFRCPKEGQRLAALKRRLKQSDLEKMFVENGCVLLSEYIGDEEPIEYRCSCGRLARSTFASVKQYWTCKVCGRERATESSKTVASIGLANYNTYADRLSSVGVDTRLHKNGAVEVRCHLGSCNQWFLPTVGSVQEKLKAAEGRIPGESNLYCSDKCKNLCSTYRVQCKTIDIRSILYVKKTERELARNCQTKDLKKLQCDEYGHNYCEKCGDIIDVELHHTLPVAQYGNEAIHSSGHILLCAGCHVDLHAEC